jgi:hypothetical protein
LKPLYIASGSDSIAALYEPPSGAGRRTAVLLVPPLGWDEQTSYRPRHDWSKALAACGFANLRIDLPGTGDSSGTPRDPRLVDSWIRAVANSVNWLRSLGARRVAVIALGGGGLLTLQAMATGTEVDDLILWGVPASGRALVREVKAFGRLEQSQTGEQSGETSPGELRAGGHVLTAETVAALSELDGAVLAASARPDRVLLLGRDGRGPEPSLAEALAGSGAAVATNGGRGWGEALARPQSTSPTAIFELVNEWLAQKATPGAAPAFPVSAGVAEFGAPGARIRETPILFGEARHRLYAILSEPVDVPIGEHTVVLFNAGAIRRIGPNRMWTEAARRWASAGIPVLRVDLEGIGDADGDGSLYRDSDDPFYTQTLIDQARSTLDLAVERGLPDRFILAGLCSGAFWGFQIALADARVQAVAALNPRMLIFDPDVEGHREMRRLRRIITVSGFRRMLAQERKLKRVARLLLFVLVAPVRALRRPPQTLGDRLLSALRMMQARGQSIDIGFCGNEPLHDELRSHGSLTELERAGLRIHELPYVSHTLKPLAAQQAAHALLDGIVERSFPSTRAPSPGRLASCA